MSLRFEAGTAYLIAGLLYLVLPLSVWLLSGARRPRVLTEWCVGGLLVGLFLVLLSLRPALPRWLAYEATLLLGFSVCDQ